MNADRPSRTPAIDAHVHVWDTARLTYPWLRQAPHLDRPHLPIDLTSESGERVVFVQADAEDGAAEARWVQSLSAEWPGLAGIVAFAPVEEPALAERLDELSTLPLLVGVRRLLQDEEAGFIASEDLVTGLRLLADRRIPFDACVRWYQLEEPRDGSRPRPHIESGPRPPRQATGRSRGGFRSGTTLAPCSATIGGVTERHGQTVGPCPGSRSES